MVDMSGTAFANMPVTGAATGQYSHSNAAYDAGGNLYFYVYGSYDPVAQNYMLGIYSPTSILLQSIGTSQGGWSGFSSDVEIVPVPGDCYRFYVIYSADNAQTSCYVYYAVVDCSSGSPIIVSYDNLLTPSSTGGYYAVQHVAFAVSQSFSTPFNGRYLFIQFSGGIDRWNIEQGGINTLALIQSPVLGFDYESPELDLYDDGTNRILAWGTSKLNTLILGPGYGPSPNFHSVTTGGIMGIEIVSPNRVFTCGPLGIQYYAIGFNTPTPVANTNDYTNSELEMPINGKLMCVKNGGPLGGQLNYVDDPLGAPFIFPTPTYTPLVKSNDWSMFTQYKLPDQIEYNPTEYQNFGNFIVPTADAGLDFSACQGDNVALYGTGTNYTTSSWYQQPGNILLCTGCTSWPLTATGTHTYTFVTQSGTNCFASDDVVVTVNPNPAPNLGPDLVLCLDEPAPNLTVTPCLPGWTNVWSYPGFCLESNCMVNLCNAGTYCVTTTDANGCTGSDCMNVSYIDCTPCSITAQYSFLQQSLNCATINFIDGSVSNPYTTITGWLWNFGDGTTSTDQNPVHTFYYNGGYGVTLTVFGTDAEGNCCSDTYSKKVSIKCPCKPKKPYITVTQMANCTVNFSESSSTIGTSHIIAWQWNFGDGTQGYGQNISHTYATGGTYTVSLVVTAFNGDECCTLEPLKTDVTVICDQEKCEVNAEFIFSIDYGYVDFFDLSTFGTGTIITGYLWEFGDGGTSNLQNPEHTYFAVGTYHVCLTVVGYANDRCCSSKICHDVEITEIAEFQKGDQKLQNPGSNNYEKAWLGQNKPNPFSDATTIRCYVPDGSVSAVLMVYNMTGKMIESRKIDQRGNISIDLSLREFNDGLYTYCLVVDNVKIGTKQMAVIR